MVKGGFEADLDCVAQRSTALVGSEFTPPPRLGSSD